MTWLVLRADQEQQREPLKSINIKHACDRSIMALLVALMSTGVEAKVNHVEVRLVRATKYHKTDQNCDHWTEKGYTSTQLRLPQCEKVVTNPHTIGFVALDPKKVPEGSLVFETQTGRFFVATTGGEAVIDRDAAIKTAERKNLPSKYKNALVFDFYYPREIIDNEFTYCWVIPYEGDVRFRNLKLSNQKKRLHASFWLERLSQIEDSIKDEAERQKLRQMMSQLVINDRKMTSG